MSLNRSDTLLWHYSAGDLMRGSEWHEYQTVPNSSKLFQTIPNSTKQYQTVPNSSKLFQTVPNSSKQFQTVPNSTKQYPTVPISTQQFQSVPNSSNQYPTVPISTQQFQPVKQVLNNFNRKMGRNKKKTVFNFSRKQESKIEKRHTLPKAPKGELVPRDVTVLYDSRAIRPKC